MYIHVYIYIYIRLVTWLLALKLNSCPTTKAQLSCKNEPVYDVHKIVAGWCWNRIKHVRAMCVQSALCLLMFTFPIANVFMSRFQRPRCLKPWLQPLLCWYCRFESRRGNGCLSVVSVMCCQVEVSATSVSFVRRILTNCGASLCVIYKPQEWCGHGPHWAHGTTGKNTLLWKTHLKVLLFQQVICRFLKLLLTVLFQTWFLYVNNVYTSNSKKEWTNKCKKE